MTWNPTYYTGAIGSVQKVYEGFAIKVSEILGSGQRLYTVEGLGGEVTTFQAAYEIIEKHLKTWVEPVKVVTEMSQEMFDQLQSGTLAIQENIQLKNILAAEEERLLALKEWMSGQYSSLEGMQTGVQDARDKLGDIPDSVQAALDGMKGTLQLEIDKFRDITDRIKAGTATLEAQKSVLEDMKNKMATISENMKATIAAYEKALAAKGAMGWLEKIPIIMGAGIAIILGIKVLDVMD